MSEWKAKRFWRDVGVTRLPGGFGIALDGRPVRTPAKAALEVPSCALADMIAAEWSAQEGEIDPWRMPFTRSANAAIDKVARQHGEVAQMIAGYADSDTVCYRAAAPDALAQRQAEAWEPLLDWTAERFGARLRPVTGIMHHPQEAAALTALSAQVLALDAFALTALHDLVSLSGSLVIGLAAIHDRHPPGKLWQLSRIDETWQQELWGVDEDAREHAALKENDFVHAKRFHDLSRPSQ